jgi:hypothetical protein
MCIESHQLWAMLTLVYYHIFQKHQNYLNVTNVSSTYF